MSSPEEICRFICKLEEKYELFNLEYLGVQFWPLVRAHVYDLCGATRGAIHPDSVSQRRSRNGPRPEHRRHGATFLGSLSRARFVVIPGEVRYRTDKGLADPYSEQLLRELPKNETRVLEYARIGEVSDYQGHEPSLSLAGLNSTANVALKCLAFVHAQTLGRIRSVSRTDTVLAAAAEEIFSTYGVRAPLVHLKVNSSLYYLSRYPLYRCLFALLRPEWLFVVSTAGKEAIIEAARRSGARVAELQHGVIGSQNPVYEYGGANGIRGKPDLLLTFGQLWTRGVGLPNGLPQNVIGFHKLNAYQNSRQKKKKRIVFLSGQPFVGDLLLDYCEICHREFFDYELTVRLHPNQFLDYRKMLDERGLSRVEVDDGSTGIHALLADTEVVITGHSTSLFEAIALKCKVLVVDSPYRGLHERLLSNTGCRFVSRPDDVVDAVNSVVPAEDRSGLFAPPVDSIVETVLYGSEKQDSIRAR